MKYYLTIKYNGKSRGLITMALLREDNTLLYVGFKDVMNMVPEKWVADNIVPAVNYGPVRVHWRDMEDIQQDLLTFFNGDADVVIITTTPLELMLFNQVLMVEDKMIGNAIMLPKLTFQLIQVKAYPTEVTTAVEHCAAWDAIALRHKLDYPNGMKPKEPNP